MIHFLADAYSSSEGARSGFDLQNLILDVKHLERYPEFRPEFMRIYSDALAAGADIVLTGIPTMEGQAEVLVKGGGK